MSTDTLKLAQALRHAGHSSETAEGTAAAVADFIGQGTAALATKEDLQALELRLIKWLLGVAGGTAVVIIGAVAGIIRVMLH